MDQVLELLTSFGLTFVLVSSTILDRPRKWLTRIKVFASLLSCYFCTGFWSGLALAASQSRGPVDCFKYGLASAAFAYTLDVSLKAIESVVDKTNG